MIWSVAHHTNRKSAVGLLISIIEATPSEYLQCECIGMLIDLKAYAEVDSFAYLLNRTPSVSWSVHSALLNDYAKRAFQVGNSVALPDFDEIDDLDMAEALLRYLHR